MIYGRESADRAVFCLVIEAKREKLVFFPTFTSSTAAACQRIRRDNKCWEAREKLINSLKLYK